MKFLQLFACSLVLLLTPAAPAWSFGLETHETAAARAKRGDVYLLRGFGNVFSRGLDAMGSKLSKSGVSAKVIGHGSWQSAVRQIVKNRKKRRTPVVLIGHSLGANKALRMAEALAKERIPVSFLVTFAATNPRPVPRNVRKATNYYFESEGWGEKLKRGPGFRGRLKNIDFSKSKTVGHFNIDKQPRLQRQVINNVLRIVGARKRASAGDLLTTPAG